MLMDQYRVVPMRLFATWEGDRASSNCVPRLCTLTLNRLTVFKTLDTDLNCLVIAVKLQGYKRTLRSNDINVTPINGIIDVDLDISFTLQYPHFIKKKSNSLLVMLQRRRRYKNRPIPGGFKTLAVGMISLTEVLQHSTGIKELTLHSDLEDEEQNAPPASHHRHHQPATAKLYLHTLSSQPLEQDDSKLKEPHGEFTDEEEEDSTANDDGGSDSEPAHAGDDVGGPPSARSKRGAAGATSAPLTARARFASRQKNFKQKFVALLKKFKISEEEVLKAVDSESQQPTEQEIRDLLEELDNYSNSDPEPNADTISVKSAPKPSLRPYFSSTTASRERLPTIENGAKDSEESKESGGDSQADIDTTDPEQSEIAAAGGSVASPPSAPIRIGATAEASVITSPTFTASATANSGAVSVAPKSVSVSVNAKEQQSRGAFSRPMAGRSSDKKKKLSPSIRQASADVTPSATYDALSSATRHQSMLERLHASSTSSSRLRSGKENASPYSGFTFPTPLPHQSIAEQLAHILPPEETNLVPDAIVLLSAYDVRSQSLLQGLKDKVTTKLAVVSSQSDVKMVIGTVLNRIQKYCHTNVFQTQNAVKLILIGADRLFAYCLKAYTELLAQKSNEWLHFTRIFVVGPPWSVVCRCLSNFDHAYSNMFGDNFWRDWWDKSDMGQQDILEVVNRVSRYLHNAKLTLQLPVAEAMLQLKDKGTGEEMSNIFVPFVVDVRRAATGESVGADTPVETFSTAAGSACVPQPSGSPPNSFAASAIPSPRAFSYGTTSESAQAASGLGHSSPPGSPHAAERSGPGLLTSAGEAQDLQIEYWTSTGYQGPGQGPGAGSTGSAQRKELSAGGSLASGGAAIGAGGSGGGQGTSGAANLPPTKYSLKTAFKSLIITRLPPSPSSLLSDTPSPASLVVQFVKEKKKDKVLQKLGMKNKEKIESEQKSQSIDGISRMICSAKQHATMKLHIDGVEWTNVKFFQISAQWQTHVKHMPTALFHIDS